MAHWTLRGRDAGVVERIKAGVAERAREGVVALGAVCEAACVTREAVDVDLRDIAGGVRQNLEASSGGPDGTDAARRFAASA